MMSCVLCPHGVCPWSRIRPPRPHGSHAIPLWSKPACRHDRDRDGPMFKRAAVIDRSDVLCPLLLQLSRMMACCSLQTVSALRRAITQRSVADCILLSPVSRLLTSKAAADADKNGLFVSSKLFCFSILIRPLLLTTWVYDGVYELPRTQNDQGSSEQVHY